MLEGRFVEIRNFTGRLERAEAFLRAKAALADTAALSIHIKFTRARGRDMSGYYRWNDQRMVLAVKQRLRYPRSAAYGVGTTPRSDRRLGGLPYRLVWHEERFDAPDDLLVFVAGHEFWHFLCHSGQRKRDHETKANCNGFAWLREFREWDPVGPPVAEIPVVPPRPDRSMTEAAVTGAMLPPWVTNTDDARPSASPSRATVAAQSPASPAPGTATAAGPTRARTGMLEAARQLLLFR